MKVLAVSHDPGGANAVGAVVRSLRGQGVQVDLYAKGPAVPALARLNVACQVVGDDHQAATRLAGHQRLLAGSSAVDRFERDALAVATAAGVPSLSVMDYWANFAARFDRNADTQVLLLPDVVTALDAVCARQMEGEGISAARIQVTGQPYFSWLMERASLWPQTPRTDRTCCRIFFASQPFANEDTTLGELLAVLRQRPDCHLTVRFHPRQGPALLSRRLLREASTIFSIAIDDSLDPLSTIVGHDLVVGMTSTILIEAAVLGIAVASVLFDRPDTLPTQRLGLPTPIRSRAELSRLVADLRPGDPRRPLPHGLAGHAGADARVADLVLDPPRMG